LLVAVVVVAVVVVAVGDSKGLGRCGVENVDDDELWNEINLESKDQQKLGWNSKVFFSRCYCPRS
jgi:hypothetical protein